MSRNIDSDSSNEFENNIKNMDRDIDELSDEEFEKTYGVSKEIVKYEGMTKEEYEELSS